MHEVQELGSWATAQKRMHEVQELGSWATAQKRMHEVQELGSWATAQKRMHEVQELGSWATAQKRMHEVQELGSCGKELTMKALQHLKTINHHKWLVLKACFKLGMYKQGLLHDLSKYSPTEFMVGVRYYQGTRSPNNAEREARGYTTAWLHHKGRNKHHMEYWLDYDLKNGGVTGMKMPVKYVVEMFCDRVCASKNYNRDTYTDQMPLQYYNKGKSKYLLHPDTAKLLVELLTMLARDGEEKTFRYIKTEILTKEVRRERV